MQTNLKLIYREKYSYLGVNKEVFKALKRYNYILLELSYQL